MSTGLPLCLADCSSLLFVQPLQYSTFVFHNNGEITKKIQYIRAGNPKYY